MLVREENFVDFVCLVLSSMLCGIRTYTHVVVIRSSVDRSINRSDLTSLISRFLPGFEATRFGCCSKNSPINTRSIGKLASRSCGTLKRPERHHVNER